jgi:hypothetical protein
MTKKSVIIISIVFYLGVILITSSPFQHNSLFKNNASFSLNDILPVVYAKDDGGGDKKGGDKKDKKGGDKKDKKDKKGGDKKDKKDNHDNNNNNHDNHDNDNNNNNNHDNHDNDNNNNNNHDNHDNDNNNNNNHDNHDNNSKKDDDDDDDDDEDEDDDDNDFKKKVNYEYQAITKNDNNNNHDNNSKKDDDDDDDDNNDDDDDNDNHDSKNKVVVRDQDNNENEIIITSNKNTCPTQSNTVELKGKIGPKGIRLLADFDPCTISDGSVTFNIPNTQNIKLAAIYIDKNGNDHAGTLIDPVKIQNLNNRQGLYTTELDDKMKGTSPVTGQANTLTKINALALYNNGNIPVQFKGGNTAALTAIFTK